ncbi:hypothetical protein BDR06DRAFT_782080 [Suillus hirtellus]|nr:hypothetical protein BDR06DRAFT_782080 [Suillus hirtellus]
MYPSRSQDEPIIIVSFHYITFHTRCSLASFFFCPYHPGAQPYHFPQPLATILQRTLYTLSNSSQRFKHPSSQPEVSFLISICLTFVSIFHSPSNLHFAPCSSCGASPNPHIAIFDVSVHHPTSAGFDWTKYCLSVLDISYSCRPIIGSTHMATRSSSTLITPNQRVPSIWR